MRETVVLAEGFSTSSEIVGSGDYDGDGLSDVLIYNSVR